MECWERDGESTGKRGINMEDYITRKEHEEFAYQRY